MLRIHYFFVKQHLHFSSENSVHINRPLASEADLQRAFAEHEGILMRYAQHIAQRFVGAGGYSPVLARDLYQDAYLRAFQKRHLYEGRSSFSSWVFSIMNNIAHNTARKKSAREYPVDAQIVFESHDRQLSAAADRSVLVAVERSESQRLRREALEQSLEELPEHYRIALVLMYLEDMKYREIAESMSWSLEKVRGTLHRARIALAKILSSQLSPELLNDL